MPDRGAPDDRNTMDVSEKAVEAAAKYLAYLVDGDPYPADAIPFGAKVDPDDEDHARELIQYIAPLIAAQALRDHAANLRFIANRSRQDEAVGLDQAADIAKARADELEEA